jgi:alkyldihydroxyacetonephosphate synthase
MIMDRKNLRWNGWGLNTQPNPLPDDAPQWDWIRETLGLSTLPATPALPLSQIHLAPSLLSNAAIERLRAIVGEANLRLDDYERVFHARGKSYHDLLYLRAGRLDMLPAAVVYPRNADEVLAVVKYAAGENISLVPFGGGSSVVGGVNAASRSMSDPVLTLDTTLMSRVLQIDKLSMTARIEAGIYGPALEKALQAHGVTLGHYPQSFEYSTLGGWIAARGAGQQSNRYGKAEHWLVSAKLATPLGFWTTESSPASAAGPDLNEIVAGSEGILGVICDATIRIHPVPVRQDYRGYLFRSFASGIDAARRLAQSDIPTAMVRLSDAPETHFLQAFGSRKPQGSLKSHLQKRYLKWRGFDEEPCLMLIGHEGEREIVANAQRESEKLCRSLGALALGQSSGEKWMQGRFASPHLRDPLMDRGIGVDTLETATRWSNVQTLYEKVTSVIGAALGANMPESSARGIVMTHLSHSYPDGASLYFTYVFPRQLGRDVEQWQAVKRAASDAIASHGGTISHHHGVGIDHAPWLAEEKGEIGLAIFKALKRELDPAGIMNPGKLI